MEAVDPLGSPGPGMVEGNPERASSSFPSLRLTAGKGISLWAYIGHPNVNGFSNADRRRVFSCEVAKTSVIGMELGLPPARRLPIPVERR